MGDECWNISSTKTSPNTYDSLLDEEKYGDIFKGTYSDTFIQIMLDIQLIWQVKENIGTYSMFSISKDYVGGISPRDREYFFTTIKDMRNKLLIINHVLEKYETNPR